MENKKIKSWVISTLRRASFRFQPRNEALVRARVDRGLYKCNICSEIFKRGDVQIDHIKPVIPLTGWDDWNGFIDRLFCDTEGFQIICTVCHDVKTTTEDTIRANNNAERKSKEKLDKKKKE